MIIIIIIIIIVFNYYYFSCLTPIGGLVSPKHQAILVRVRVRDGLGLGLGWSWVLTFEGLLGRILNYVPLLINKGPVIIYVEEGGKKGGGGQGFLRLTRGGINFLIRKLRGISSLIARYILRGVHWPRWVKQLNSRVQTIYVKQ